MTAVWDEEQMDGLQGHPAPNTNCITAEGTEKEWHTVIDHSLCPTANGPAPFISEKKNHMRFKEFAAVSRWMMLI